MLQCFKFSKPCQDLNLFMPFARELDLSRVAKWVIMPGFLLKENASKVEKTFLQRVWKVF